MNSPSTHTDVAPRSHHDRDSKRRENIDLALCLSGGGFRAALFHLGALRRLFELGVLQHVDTIASVSGGSILAAHLAERICNWDELKRIPVEERPAWWEEQVAQPFRHFTSKDIRTRSIARRLLPWNWPRTSLSVEGLESALRPLTEMTIAELPDRPTYIFCATDLATGELWESKKPRKDPLGVTSDSEAPLDWPVARAVAASSSFPPWFGPLRVHRRGSKGAQQPDHMQGFLDETSRAKGVSLDDPGGAEIAVLSMFRDLSSEGSWMHAQLERAIQHARLAKDHHLSDGGLIDNLGVMAVWTSHEHGRILVSNGGATLNASWRKSRLWRLMRYINVMNEHGRRALYHLLRASFDTQLRQGAYWDIGGFFNVSAKQGATQPISEYGYSRGFAREIARLRTDLDAFSTSEQKILENHGYMLAEMAIAQLGSGMADAHAPPPDWPHPDYADEHIARASIPDQTFLSRFKARCKRWLQSRRWMRR